jgi:hypothetical protein
MRHEMSVTHSTGQSVFTIQAIVFNHFSSLFIHLFIYCLINSYVCCGTISFDGHPEHLLELPSVTLWSGRIIKSECDVAGASSFIRSKPVKSIFYLRHMLKNKVYSNNPRTEYDLKGNIQNTVFSVMAAKFWHAMDVFLTCDTFLLAKGNYFQRLT